MIKQERLKAAEEHARKVCGDYYDLMYENEPAIQYSMGQLCTDDFIAGAEAEADSKWISCEDRLPYIDGESSIYCLVFATGYDIVVRPYNEYHKCWDQEDGDDHFTKDIGGLVTHWMPLPSPPLNQQ